MYMRDHPIPGVEWNSPDGIRQYKRAMGLELGDIEAMIQHIMTTIAPTGVYNGTPNPGECEQTPPEGQMLEENGEMLLRSSQDGQMGPGGNFTPDAQGGEQIIPSAVFGQSMTDDILFKYQLSDDAIAQYQ
ncbi:hypothetical protein FGO68_gene9363 [Halteria grandinella]|uniref:Uncharacterized protein n=1 Tax=Halteria grandinella TaxID=5974 RepID=A0A8J8T0M9_HALGN|nr:hypothetical protein FGO68_gene9363 [Halteria grandinella]